MQLDDEDQDDDNNDDDAGNNHRQLILNSKLYQGNTFAAFGAGNKSNSALKSDSIDHKVAGQAAAFGDLYACRRLACPFQHFQSNCRVTSGELSAARNDDDEDLDEIN